MPFRSNIYFNLFMNLYRYLPFAVLLCFIVGCNEIELEPSVAIKPQPLDSREIKIIVDQSLDFSNFKAHTILDSMGLDNSNEKLNGPKGSQSILFFTDNKTGEITALVQLDSASSEVNINVETVTNGVIGLAPMYASLTPQQKGELIQGIQNEQVYSLLRGTIGEILKNKEPIFSDRPEFISQLLSVNSYILKTYFPELNQNGGRINVGKEDFPSFVKKDNGMTVFNQVSSYVFLEFIPNSGGNPVSHILEPRPINPSFQSEIPKIERATLALKDDCYAVKINQSNSEVVSKNVVRMGTILTSAFLDAVIGIGIKGCAPELTAKIATKLGITLAEATNVSPTELLGEATKSVAEVVFQALLSGDCAIITNKLGIVKFVASKANLYGNLYKAAEFIYNASPAGPYAISLIPSLRIELAEKLQLYEGNLIEACIKVVKDGSINQEYSVGKELLVKIKLESQSEYGEWKKSGFKISWKIPPLNGELNLPSNLTDNNGLGSVLWRLPNEPNAVVTLLAEIKDKEGDHIAGSPVTFQTKIVAFDSLSYYNSIMPGEWQDNGATKLFFRADFTGTYSSDNSLWRIEKNSAYKNISGSDYILLVRHLGTRRTYLYAIKSNNKLLFLNAFLDYNF